MLLLKYTTGKDCGSESLEEGLFTAKYPCQGDQAGEVLFSSFGVSRSMSVPSAFMI